jgi:aminopeptidase YwaD
MNKTLPMAVAAAFLQAAPALAQQRTPLLPEPEVAALANELSGETAKRNLEGLARFHRQRGSAGFHAAAELVAERARAYGLSDVAILQFPADGKIFYGTQRSRPGWDAEKGLLTVTEYEGGLVPCGKRPGIIADCAKGKVSVLANYEDMPITLAEDSESGHASGTLIDVGEGTKESDYTGKDIRGNFVLVGAQPAAVQDLAVGKFGAIGIVSYAQNQMTAWWGEDENLIRWGHLETFSPNKTFAFMVSFKTARWLQQLMKKPGLLALELEADVKAGQHASNYEVVTATIPGADRKLRDEEIAFSCHLDHQRPGANDNASGCVTILEVARTLQKLISEGKLPRPARTIRFFWPPEIEGTLALLNGKPEFAHRIKAAVQMDMVGGGPVTKAVFHVTRGPMSLPSFVHDVAWAFAEFVNEQSYKFAATGSAAYPLVAPEGGKEPLRAEYSVYTMGSDHDVYQDSSFGIPAIYLNDWPDRYIHTDLDSAANIDTTKLKRAAFIGAASGYFLANPSSAGTFALWQLAKRGALHRQLAREWRAENLTADESFAANLRSCLYETELLTPLQSMINELPLESREGFNPEMPKCWTGYPPISQGAKVSETSLSRFKRRAEPKGPLAVFGYDYFAEHAKAAGPATPRLLSYEGLWGGREEYAYEALNFANGKRNAQEIRDAVSAEYGPIPIEMVLEYLQALEKIGIVERVK